MGVKLLETFGARVSVKVKVCVVKNEDQSYRSDSGCGVRSGFYVRQGCPEKKKTSYPKWRAWEISITTIHALKIFLLVQNRSTQRFRLRLPTSRCIFTITFSALSADNLSDPKTANRWLVSAALLDLRAVAICHVRLQSISLREEAYFCPFPSFCRWYRVLIEIQIAAATIALIEDN